MVGDAVGSLVVGDTVGEEVGFEDVGEVVGLAVGRFQLRKIQRINIYRFPDHGMLALAGHLSPNR